MKKKPARSGRKSTLALRPYHPDLQPAINYLITGESLGDLTDVIDDATRTFDEYEAEDLDEGQPNNI
jgi:hypothetical protein